MNENSIETLRWVDDHLEMIDQRIQDQEERANEEQESWILKPIQE